MLALGLADRMVGSAYLDDEIWQELAADYAKVPVISATYPTAAEIEALQPDFVYASYSSAFATSSVNYTKRLGGFLDVEDCSLTIPRPDGTNRTHCRQELHDYGIQTYLQEPFCEKVELRPETLTLDVLRAEIWTIATIFDVLEQGRAIVTSMEDHFEQARVVSSGGATATDAPKLRVRLYLLCHVVCALLMVHSPISLTRHDHLRVFAHTVYAKKQVLWLDSVDADGNPYVGACCGTVQTILDLAGAENVMQDVGVDERSTWATVSWEDIEASWDSVGTL
jgi:ABC-type Fe3+-hydroxamate transport system substrate-binding protein